MRVCACVRTCGRAPCSGRGALYTGRAVAACTTPTWRDPCYILRIYVYTHIHIHTYIHLRAQGSGGVHDSNVAVSPLSAFTARLGPGRRDYNPLYPLISLTSPYIHGEARPRQARPLSTSPTLTYIHLHIYTFTARLGPDRRDPLVHPFSASP